jgi:hypothetical protein
MTAWRARNEICDPASGASGKSGMTVADVSFPPPDRQLSSDRKCL